MQKQAPSLGRVFVMVAFALSCFGLLLFLWLSFGGSVPLKPKGYRFKIDVPEATQLGDENPQLGMVFSPALLDPKICGSK